MYDATTTDETAEDGAPSLAEMRRRVFYADVQDDDIRDALVRHEAAIRHYRENWRPGKLETLVNISRELFDAMRDCRDYPGQFNQWADTCLPFSAETAKRWVIIGTHRNILRAEYDRIPHHILIGVASLATYLTASDDVRRGVCAGEIGYTIKDMQAAERSLYVVAQPSLIDVDDTGGYVDPLDQLKTVLRTALELVERIGGADDYR